MKILSPKELASAIESDQVNSFLPVRFSGQIQDILYRYVKVGQPIEMIASELGITRTRAVLLIQKAQKQLGVEEAPPTIEELISTYDLTETGLIVKKHLQPILNAEQLDLVLSSILKDLVEMKARGEV